MKNTAEEFAEYLCRRTSLSLWIYANPRRKKNQELCDVLVVCNPDVLVISVKESEFKDTGRPKVDLRRWQKKAIDKSVKQVFGAERMLSLVDTVTAQNGSTGLRLPAPEQRRVHRIAVAIGGENRVPLASGEYKGNGGNHYVHMFDSVSFGIVMQELDTITDLVNYLRAKKSLQAPVMLEGEEDLLALYLQNGHSFPDATAICIDGGVWNSFMEHPQYLRRKEEDKPSYTWDRIIETFCQHQLNGDLLGNASLDDVEEALRTMAREDRFTRRGLGKAFREFLEANQAGKSRSRICAGPGKATYVFLGCPVNIPRSDRVIELEARCRVARVLLRDKPTVVGIATETPKPGQGFSLDLIYLHIPTISPKYETQVKQLQDEFGFFRNPQHQKRHEEEYPS